MKDNGGMLARGKVGRPAGHTAPRAAKNESLHSTLLLHPLS